MKIRYEVRDHVAEILFDNPPVNALTDDMMDELLDALARARDDATVRAVVIGSALQERFCAGLDLPLFRRSSPAEVRTIIDKLYAQLCQMQFGLGKPSIAAIGGAVRGGGISIAISCDMIVADRTATFGYPEIDIGLLPAIHYTSLPRIVGRYRAFDLLFTGRTFPASEALAIGLASRLAEPGKALEEAHAVARVLASKSPELVRAGKAAFVRGIDTGYTEGVRGAVDLLCEVVEMDDSREGLASFAEKRTPVWKR